MKYRIQLFAALMGVLFVSLSVPAAASADGPSQWTVTSTKVPQLLFDISCPSTTLCVATDWDGDLSVSTDPTGGTGTWHEVSIPEIPHMMAVSCPSTTLCVAVGTFNRMAISTNPAGGSAAWDTVSMENGLVGLQTVDCPSTSLCVAFDAEGNILTSANPAGGVGAWSESKNTTIPGIPWSFSLDCPSTSLCVAGRTEGVSTSTNPVGGTSAWGYTELWSDQNPVNTMSCPSTTLCVATDQSGNLLTSTNPTGGAGAWSSVNINDDPLDALFWVECPKTSFCVGFDNHGNLLTSENPAAGAGSWSFTPLASPLADLRVGAMSCPLTTLCVAIGWDNTGTGSYIVTGTVPGSDPPDGDSPGGNPGAGGSAAGSRGTLHPVSVPAVRCKVPYLKGKSLRAAKQSLKRSNCRLGTVSRPKTKQKRLTVHSQSPKAGSVKPVGTKVSVRLV